MLSTVCPCCPFSTLRWPMERGAAAAPQRERWAGERTSAKDDQRELAGFATSAEIKKRKRAVSPHPESTAAQRSLARAPCFACQATQQRSSNAVLHGLLVLLARQSSNAAERSRAWAPCFACQGRQQYSTQQRSRTQSCMGSFLRLPVTAATQQNAVLHGRLFALARHGSNAASSNAAATQSCTGFFLRLPGKAAKQQRSLARAPCFACQGRQQHTWQARRSSSTTVIQHDGTVRRKSWPSRGYPVLGHRPLGFQPVCQCVCFST